MNVFYDLYRRGKIASRADLRKTYRLLSKKVHPDVSCHDASGDRFARLKQDYDEFDAALDGFLAENTGTGGQPAGADMHARRRAGCAVVTDNQADVRSDRLRQAGNGRARVDAPARCSYDSMMDLFQEIEATGFLLERSSGKRSGLYMARLQLFDDMLAECPIPGVQSIKEIEKLLHGLKSCDRTEYGIVKLIIHNAISYHMEQRTFVLSSTEQLYSGLAGTAPPADADVAASGSDPEDTPANTGHRSGTDGGPGGSRQEGHPGQVYAFIDWLVAVMRETSAGLTRG